MSKKHLNEMVYNALKISFEKNELVQINIEKIKKLFSQLPKGDAIYCLSLYKKLLTAEINKQTLNIESSISLSKAEIEKIKKTFGKSYTISGVSCIINPQLIGGIKIKIGDIVYDNSLSNKINLLKENIYVSN